MGARARRLHGVPRNMSAQKSEPGGTTMLAKAPIGPHAYVEGVHTRSGRDGRVYRLCRVCDDRANASPHRGFRTTPHTIRERETDRHPFVIGTEVQTDSRGHRRALCRVCGAVSSALPHRAEVGGAILAPLDDPSDRSASAPPPTAVPVRPGPVRPAKITPPVAEIALVAIGIDRLLALPTDAVSWRLRVRLTEVRQLLDCPVLPTLDPADQVDPDASPPTDRDLDLKPSLAPQRIDAAPVVVGNAILRSITDSRRRTLVRRAIETGWSANRTASNHVALDKGATRIIVTMHEGYGRAWANTRAQAKRAGLDVTGL